MKRIFCIGLVLLLIVAAGCTPTPPPSNSPSLLPDLTPGASPDIPGGPGTTDNAGGNGTGGNAGGTAGATIPNFAEGTVMNESDLPDIKTALLAQYPGATITRITHGLQGTQQAYVVDYSMENGKVGTAYILPDGTILPDTAAASPGTSPDTSPGASPAGGANGGTTGGTTSPAG